LRIQVNSDKNIQVDARVVSFVRGKADRALARYEGKLTRVEFHLSDVNSHKPGPHDKECVIEARPAGRKPMVVRVAAANVRAAITGSLTKMQSALEKYFGRSAKIAERVVESSRPRKRTPAAFKKAAQKKATAKKAGTAKVASTAGTTKKKAIYQARRKPWPARAAA
jgi:hypothetical protein